MEYSKREKEFRGYYSQQISVLTNQTFNSFGAFDENALVRITPQDVRDKGPVPTNGSDALQSFKSFNIRPKQTLLWSFLLIFGLMVR